MRVGIWDDLPLELFAGVEYSPAEGVEFVSVPSMHAAEALGRGELDVALLPTLNVLTDPESYDVFPAVALSSWDYPFARLYLKADLRSGASRLTFERGHEFEALLARVVLREHYHADVQASAVEAESAALLLESAEDAVLLVSRHASRIETKRFSMDLGREWFELVNYPMVWGLFASLRDTSTRESIVAVRDTVSHADLSRPEWAPLVDDVVLRDFLENHVRLRLDDLATASLTELCNYVYYFGLTDDYCTIPFVSVPDDDDVEGQGGTPLV